MNFLIASLVATIVSAESPNPNDISINNVIYNGSGCPAGTVDWYLTDQRTKLNFAYDQFVAETGPEVAAKEQRKNCQINMEITYPAGWSYSVAKVDYFGYADLPEGVSAIQKNLYYFSGQSDQVESALTLNGPYNDDYKHRDTIGVESWSPCGSKANANLNASVRLVGDRNKAAVATVDRSQGKVRQVFSLNWRKC